MKAKKTLAYPLHDFRDRKALACSRSVVHFNINIIILTALVRSITISDRLVVVMSLFLSYILQPIFMECTM